MRLRFLLLVCFAVGCGRSDSLPGGDGTDGGNALPDLTVAALKDGAVVKPIDFSTNGPPDFSISTKPIDLSVPPQDDMFVIGGIDFSLNPPDLSAMPMPDGGVMGADLAVAPDLAKMGPCGGPGQACCPNDVCNAGGCCANAICVASGADCANGQVCSDGICSACGGAGAPCCANNSCDNNGCCGDNDTCVAPGGDCGGNFGTCTNQGCVAMQACGGNGQQCCQTPNPFPNFCSSPGTVCGGNNLPGLCVPCGGPGQNCCRANACDGGGCCVNNVCHASGMLCQMTMCLNGSCGGGTCGGLGQACCGGNNGVCTAPDTRCVGGNCQECGGLNQLCCNDPASHFNIVCDAPYKPSGIMMCTCTK